MTTLSHPSNRAVPPMKTGVPCEISLVFAPEDKFRNVFVRVVEELPYEFTLGAFFLRKHGSIVNFEEGRGFKPAPESP